MPPLARRSLSMPPVVRERLTGWIDALEERPAHPWGVAVTAGAVGGLGVVLETFLQLGTAITLNNVVAFGAWYLAGYHVYMAWLPRLAGRPAASLTWLACLAIPLGLLPPVLDIAIYGLYRTHTSFFYSFEPTLHSTGTAALPGGPETVTWGPTLCVWLLILAATTYVWLRRRSWWRAGLAFIAAWASIVLISYLPPLLFEGLQRWLTGDTEGAGLLVVLALVALTGPAWLVAAPRRALVLGRELPRALALAAALLLGGLAVAGLTRGLLLGAVVCAAFWLLSAARAGAPPDPLDPAPDTAVGEARRAAATQLAVLLALGVYLAWRTPGILLLILWLACQPLWSGGPLLAGRPLLGRLVFAAGVFVAFTIGVTLATPTLRLEEAHEPRLAALAAVVALLSLLLPQPARRRAS